MSAGGDPKHRLTLSVGMVALLLLVATCALGWGATPKAQPPKPAYSPQEMARLGGDTTIYNKSKLAFSQPVAGLEGMDELLFFVGNSFFNQNWVQAPSSTSARDGLGPLFNARSCAACHFKDGRGRAPERAGEVSGFLLRLGVPTARHAQEEPQQKPRQTLRQSHVPSSAFGQQLQDFAVEGVAAEAQVEVRYQELPGRYGDGRPYSLQKTHYLLRSSEGELEALTLSPRVANQMIGMGLLEAIPEASLKADADPDDADGDGISGRVNRVWDLTERRQRVGRFGWKAEQPSVLQQVATAFVEDIGITNRVHPQVPCTRVQRACQRAKNGGVPEIAADDLDKVVLYSRSLAVPAQRGFARAQVKQGARLFQDLGCQGCHAPTQQSAAYAIPALAGQTFHPYTDLLLHDMGPGLADNLRVFEASGREWRTPPLWGIGLFKTVNDHTRYLHDGRARNLAEAILWHGGEAHAAKERFRKLPKAQREQLLSFLESL